MVNLTKEDLKSVEELIAKVEATTSGEIVVRIVPESHFHGDSSLIVGLLGATFSSAILLGESFLDHWEPPLTRILVLQAIGFVGGLLLSLSAPVKRLFVSKKAMTREVTEAAMVEFLRLGIDRTEKRTGILIFVSLFERRVIIHGDEGIHSKVGNELWNESVSHIITAIKGGRPVEGLLKAISQMGDQLKIHFPGVHTRDELSNSVITDPL